MGLVSERGVRESFGRVKKDMQDVRESLADVSQALQSLSSKSSGFADKKEFYDFIKAFEARFDGFESSLATKQDLKKLRSAHNKKHVRNLKSQKKSFSSLKSGLAGLRKAASWNSRQFKEMRRISARLSSELAKERLKRKK
ncbi:hypothetical protein HYV82_00130 [Candidatus Woesearchaeota archaeon]|nr:hypothetical protein [Candidatus Woesearchaeota archaeon]